MIDDLPINYLKKLTDDITDGISEEKERFLKMVGERRIENTKQYFELQINKATELFVKENTKMNNYWEIVTEILWDNFKRLFRSKIFFNKGNLNIYEVFRWSLKNENIRMSDLIIEQVKYAWENPKNINKIILNNVVNEEIVNGINKWWFLLIENNWWKIWWLDRMTVKIVEKLWKKNKKYKCGFSLEYAEK